MALVASEWALGSESPNFGNPVLMSHAILGAETYFFTDFRVSGGHIYNEDTISTVTYLAQCLLHCERWRPAMVTLAAPVAALISFDERQENSLLSSPWPGTLQL